MNPTLWILAGALAGALAYAVLNLNLDRGLTLSVTIGVVTAYLGGELLAPLLGATMVEAGAFNPFALLVAGATALASLLIADMMAKRFGY